jgi:hypothetical protein
MTNYQRGILSAPMKAAVGRAEVPVAGGIPGPERGERALLDLGTADPTSAGGDSCAQQLGWQAEHRH